MKVTFNERCQSNLSILNRMLILVKGMRVIHLILLAIR